VGEEGKILGGIFNDVVDYLLDLQIVKIFKRLTG
jgi:hypothetical protein